MTYIKFEYSKKVDKTTVNYFTDSVHFTDLGTSTVAKNYFNVIVENKLSDKSYDSEK